LGIDISGLALEPPGGPASVRVVVPVVAAGADKLESRRKLAVGMQGGEAREEVPPHQVARAAENDEPVDHAKARGAVVPSPIRPRSSSAR